MADQTWVETHGALQAAGRASLRAFVDIVAEAVPDAGPPELSQVKSVVWSRGDQVWVRCFTDMAHQIAVEVRALDTVPARQVADELGWDVFDTSSSASEKLALNSSVGLDPGGHMRMIIKSPEELWASRTAMKRLLRQSWQTLGSD